MHNINTTTQNLNSRIEREIEFYKTVENVHDLPKSYHYVAEKYLNKYADFESLITKYIIELTKNGNNIKIISLGSGNCDFEISLLKKNNFKCELYCYELNPHMLERGRKLAADNNIKNVFFIQCNINKIEFIDNYDIILANHSLHHFTNLEHIFSQVSNCMTENSYFIINDMIGRNGHMFWDNTLDFCNMIWALLPKELKYNQLLKRYEHTRTQWDCSQDGFEGIRAQDILPLLDDYFIFTDFVPFFPIASKFVDRDFGHNYDLDNPLHKSMLNLITELDNYILKNKLLKPVQLIAAMQNRKNATTQKHKINPKDIYLMNDNKIWEHFDSSIASSEWIQKYNELQLEKDELQQHYHVLMQLHDDLCKENDGLQQQYNLLISQRDSLVCERDAILNSTSWKITKPFRAISKIILGLKGRTYENVN